MSRFAPLDRVSSWRRLSTTIWHEPTSPQVLGFDDIDMTALNERVARDREATGERLTITHYVVKAVADVMAAHPDLNVTLIRGKPVRRTAVDVFVQVALPKQGEGAGGADLSGVRVADADRKSVVEIARDLGARAHRVRVGEDQQMEKAKKTLDQVPHAVLKRMVHTLSNLSFDWGFDLTRMGVEPDPFGCAMVTNCSGFGVNTGFAPLVPIARTPVIFLLGRTEDRAVVVDGEVVVRPVMRVGGTFDHRLLDGYQIGVICTEFKRRLENPDGLVLGA